MKSIIFKIQPGVLNLSVPPFWCVKSTKKTHQHGRCSTTGSQETGCFWMSWDPRYWSSSWEHPGGWWSAGVDRLRPGLWPLVGCEKRWEVGRLPMSMKTEDVSNENQKFNLFCFFFLSNESCPNGRKFQLWWCIRMNHQFLSTLTHGKQIDVENSWFP